MALRAAELEMLFTADISDVERAEKKVKAIGEEIEKKPAKKQVTGEEKEALASMKRVEDEAKKLVSKDTALKLDADIGRAEKNLDRAKQRLADLEVRALGGLDVTADVKRAEANLSKIERNLAGLQAAKNEIRVEVDPAPAESQMKQFVTQFEKKASDAGTEGGKSLSSNLDSATRGVGEGVGSVVGGDIEGSLVAALTAIPIAGGIILAGVAIGKALTGAIQDGLSQEVGFDRLQALTGIDEATALRLGRAAGEAYANTFGESVEQNMDTTRLALQFDIIDADTTTRDAQRVVEGLAGISDVLGEDVRPIATVVTTLLRTGLAKTAEEAFDILAAGAREGLNRSEDLLDTFTEYPVVLQRLGLTGKETLGLLNQGLEAGARNTDVVADALKEFQIRSTDASDASATGYERIGLNAEKMTAKIARGGEEAREGLDQVLDALRNTEDPVQRNAAAVELFGTKAEDLGNALFALDLDTAAAKFDNLEGSARRMFDTLASNDASNIEQARRNIEVAADGIKGALAAAFSEPLGDLAEFVSQNRGPVLQFLSDMANSAFDFGVTLVTSTADGTEALGQFVSGPLAEVVDGVGRFMEILNIDNGDISKLAEDMRSFDEVTEATATTMREGLIPPIEDARNKFNGFLDPAITLGHLSDASLRLADSIATVGLDAEGAALGLDGFDVSNARATYSGRILHDQVRDAIAALGDEVEAAAAAGEGQAELASRYDTGTAALATQLQQMGLTKEGARQLIDQVLKTPASKTTSFSSNATDQQLKVEGLANRIQTLPDGSVIITADDSSARATVERFITFANGKVVSIPVRGSANFSGPGLAKGGPVWGRGTETSDSIPAWLSHNEHVWTAAETRAAGGHANVMRLRQLAEQGRLRDYLPGFAVGGPVTVRSPSPSTWRIGPTMAPSVMTDPGVMDLLSRIERALLARSSERRSVSMPLSVTAPPGEDPRVWARAVGREIAYQIL